MEQASLSVLTVGKDQHLASEALADEHTPLKRGKQARYLTGAL